MNEKVQRQQQEESERRFKELLKQAPIAMVVLRGPEHVIEMVNHAMLKRWNKTEEFLLGKPLGEAFAEVKNREFLKLLNVTYKTGQPYKETEAISNIETRGPGRTSYCDFEYAALFDADGNVTGIISTVTDVTERVEARKKLEENDVFNRTVLESSPDCVKLLDLDGKLTFINLNGVCILEGENKEFFINRQWHTMWGHDNQQRVKDAVADALTGKTIQFKAQANTVKGTPKWWDVMVTPILDADKKVISILASSRDITEAVIHEQEQKSFAEKLEAQVQERTQQLEQTNAELEKMNHELQSFAYISSHDLQEPLRKIQTFSSRLLDKEYDNLTDNGKDWFKRMQSAAHRMQVLINDLLAYSRTTTAERVFEQTDVSTLIDDVREDLKEEIKAKQALIEVIDICPVKVIPFQFRQLLQNLLSNALKFSKPDVPPHIVISCKNEKRDDRNGQVFTHIRVTDNGIGFEPEYKEKIFEVFQRLHGKSEYAGTGIGLAIVKKIAENHGGFIKATAQSGQGATFDVFIPE